jgi:biopolymer transport protein ExbD
MNFGASGLREDPEISLTSLIDVVFTLIIFFVVTTTFDERSALKLELPQASRSLQTAPEDPLVLVVDQDGRFYIGSNEVLKKDAESLREAIESIAGDDRNRPVILRGDARASHQDVITALDALGRAGFTRISIATAATEEAK